MAIYIEKPKCIGCKLCIPSCPYGAIDMVDGKAEFNDSCTSCGACAYACPTGAIVLEMAGKGEVDTSQYKGIWVVGEVTGEGSSAMRSRTSRSARQGTAPTASTWWRTRRSSATAPSPSRTC